MTAVSDASAVAVAADAPADAPAADASSDLVVEELLVEDVSIDGMCGVY